ncbi:hypothetical protein GWN63_06410, partial [Candidatus Bathyarchaeota archaeon]|nr:hypothetical protein [Candidatus Bathyarchaeota archaeon]NIR14447.1 hypothetical protein [Desulfobacterales bacterium]NIU81851.1 hypothetical protein [Candidatus Bathyarchaeota archaeon]NIV68485.1 hypothetical protein [Candidatus Bathyarchaeota archaeon]NIW34990.1 hypothetical protein [Candidatus Bathyarchaeota archaeon]
MAKAEEIQKRLDDTRKELRSLQTEEKKLLNEKAERLVKGKDPSKTTKKIR